MQVQPDDVGGLGCELRVGAHAPAAPTLQLDLVLPQHPPDLGGRDVAQGFGHQAPVPAGVPSRRRVVEQGENPPLHLLAIAHRRARTWRILQSGQPVLGEARPPFTDGGRAHAPPSGDTGGRLPLRGCQDGSDRWAFQHRLRARERVPSIVAESNRTPTASCTPRSHPDAIANIRIPVAVEVRDGVYRETIQFVPNCQP